MGTKETAVEYDREFVRRKLSVKLTYQFGRDELSFTARDGSGELQFAVRYDAINVLAPYRLTTRDPLGYFLMMVPGLAMMGVSAVVNHGPLAMAFCWLGLVLILASVALRASGPITIRYTMFKLQPPPAGAGNSTIRVIEGLHHDAIVTELRTRWRDQLRRMHLSVNPRNDPQREAAKFAWMRDNGVISSEEHDSAIRTLELEAPAQELEPTLAGGQLN